MHLDDLARRAMALMREQSRSQPQEPRIIVAIAGSPGSGKTTLAAALVARVNTLAEHLPADGPLAAGPLPRGSRAAGQAPAGPRPNGLAPADPRAADPPSDGLAPAGPIAVHLPMDGFHLANATLDALGRHDRKGAIDTFDGWGYLALVRRLHAERDHTVYAPGFDRRIDEPVAGEIAVAPDARLMVVEGNYLLVDEPPWSLARPLFAESWFVATPADERMRRLVTRHTRFGRTEAEARRWAESVDGANAALIEPTASGADLVIDAVTGMPPASR
ncbi:nucleoside/nucleotide kinase family protein [Subtercola endophyticus]|uniref:nucleoside/nucleotide kinase family protein n=1 Tax=Subtercola endophyticus TaxID=2895559 RepID=UPI001E523F53|nr:nucleoside/nucleotide kinase family protein [Subtercola endophyticus]UFS58199.1 nucleoside/nucleotide kinase family protein [Subtercola endophyticus]